MEFPVVRDQFFYPIYLNELIDWQSFVVQEYVKVKKSAKEVVDSLIIDIQYPWWLGQPDDSHTLNMYHGQYKWCKRIDEDFWDKASMVLGTNKVADCDGSAITAVACLRALGLKPEDTYVAFGVVKDASSGQILGGHAYTFARDSSFGTSKYVLCEMTLDEPPERYPEVGSTLDDLKKPFGYENIVYEPEWLFNDVQFIEVPSSDKRMMLKFVKRKKKRFVENRMKYEAIAKAWKINTKPLRKFRSKLARIRERI
jgi:hypothetical protein